MLRYNDHKQQQIFDPWKHISPKRRQMLDESWPGLFRKFILPDLPVREFEPFFNPGFGRPTKDIDTVMGLLILQQTLDLDDEETITQLSFNIQFHYALNIIEESDSAKYICPKTLWNMRRIAVENGLDTVLFQTATTKLSSVFNVNTDKQRIDSVHIKSNMRRLGRIGIFSAAIHKFLKNLKRHQSALFESIEHTIVERYLSEKAIGCFAMVKPSQSTKTLEQVSVDLYDLIQRFKDHEDVSAMHSFKQLQRILSEQCEVRKSCDDVKVVVKEPKEIPSDSLQNPSDPDATYSGHKGQGYQVQIMETYTDTENIEDKAKTLNLITHVEVERAHESDAKALIPAIESTKQRDLCPKQLLADSLYGSDENVEFGTRMGVEVVSPPMGSEKEGDLSLSEFHIEPSGKVVCCPEGHTPVYTKKNKVRFCAAFDPGHCCNCPKQQICPVSSGGKAFYLRFTDKQLRIALRRKMVETEAFKDRYRWRAGVEATMSEFDRRTGVKRLRVRGFKAVRFYATLKALGLNILRAAAVMAVILAESPENSQNQGQFCSVMIFKERFWSALNVLVRLIIRELSFMRIYSKHRLDEA